MSRKTLYIDNLMKSKATTQKHTTFYLKKVRKKNMIKNTLKTSENMKALESVILSNATLKSELQGSCNVNIDITNKVATLFGTLPQKRVEMWLDSRNVVVFVGANVKNSTVESESFKMLFENSRDTKYRISENIETKHKFESIELASEFLQALSDRVSVDEKESTKVEKTTTQKASKKTTKKTTSKKASKTA